MFMVISYDISRAKPRRRVAKVLENYGARVQYSVFEHWLTERQLEEIRAKTAPLLEEGDSIRYYPLCRECRDKISVAGTGIKPAEEPYFLG